jgi:hypothetical protein
MFEPRSTSSQHAVSTHAASANQLTRPYRASVAIRLAALAVLALAPLSADKAFAETTTTEGGAVTVTPGGTYTSGLRVAVISATDTAGDAVTAQRAFLAANMAIARTRGYMAIPQKTVAAAMKERNGIDMRGPNQQRGTSDGTFGEPAAGETRLPVDAMDYKRIGKATKADRALSIIVTRGDSSDTSATVSAIAELYDTKNGGLVGRGEGTFTATVEVPAEGVAADTAKDHPVVNGRARTAAATAEAAQARAVGGAVYRAIAELGRPLELRSTVVSLPGPYKTRIAAGELQGLRVGSRIEYLERDTPIAYGTVIDTDSLGAVATVAPESAFSRVFINMDVRNVSNPTKSRAGMSSMKQNERDFAEFERDFGVGLIAAALLYLGGEYIYEEYIKDPFVKTIKPGDTVTQ